MDASTIIIGTPYFLSYEKACTYYAAQFNVELQDAFDIVERKCRDKEIAIGYPTGLAKLGDHISVNDEGRWVIIRKVDGE